MPARDSTQRLSPAFATYSSPLRTSAVTAVQPAEGPRYSSSACSRGSSAGGNEMTATVQHCRHVAQQPHVPCGDSVPQL